MAVIEDVRYVRGIFNDVTRRNLNNRAREIEDHRYYSGINNGQWSVSAQQTMIERGQPIMSYNFIQKHIDTDSGMLLQNPFEFNFDTEIGQNPEDALLMNELRYRDKDLGRWGAENSRFTIDTLINTGVMEIFIDTAKDRLGAINFRRRIPTDFHFDPDWRTEEVIDNRQIFQSGYFDPIAILEQWGTTLEKGMEIKQAIQDWKQQRPGIKTENKTEKIIVNSEFSLQEEINGQFLVLQMHELEDIKVMELFNKTNGQFLKETLDQSDSHEDNRDRFQLLALENGISSEELTEFPVNKKKLVIKTIAPGLSHNLFLANGPDSRQIGNYPFIVASAYNQNGNRYGRVAVLKDSQAHLNKMKAVKTHWTMTASNSNKLIKTGTFDDDGEKNRYNDTRGKGGQNYDVNDLDGIKNDERGIPPTDLDQEAQFDIQFADKVGSPLSAQGQAKSGTSGVLFNAEREQAAVSLEGINDRLQKAENDKGEAYIDLALSEYGDDVSRVFKSAETKEDVFINTEDRNRISNMTRLSVRINQAPVGASVKRENLQLLTSLKQAATTPLEQAILNKLSIPLIPGLDEENKKAIEADAELGLENARKQIQAQNVQLDAAIQQSGATPTQGGPEQPSTQEAPEDPAIEQLVAEFAGEQTPQGEPTSNGLI